MGEDWQTGQLHSGARGVATARDRVWTDIGERLSEYPIQVTAVRQLDPQSAVVETPTRMLEAKIVSRESARLRRAVLEHMAAHRFRTTQRLIPTLYLDPFVALPDGNVLYLTDHWPGSRLTQHLSDVTAATRNLVTLHTAMAEWDGASVWREVFGDRPTYVDWYRECARIATSLNAIAYAAPSAEPSSLRDWAVRAADQADWAMRVLAACGYVDMLRAAEACGSMAWNGYRLSALRCAAPGNRLVTLTRADPVCDTPLFDLATFCHDLTFRTSGADVLRAVNTYGELRPLCRDEELAVIAFAAFPHQAKLWLVSRENESATTDPPWLRQAVSQHETALGLLRATGVPQRS